MTTFTMATEVDLKKKAGKFNPDDFNFVVASLEIKLKGEERDNIAFMPGIVPPSEISGLMDERYDEYYAKYLDEVLKYPIAVLLKAAIENDYDLVFVCSEAEKAMKYLPLFMEFIDETFEIPTGQFKKLLKGSAEYQLEEKYKGETLSDLQKIIDLKGEEYKDIDFIHSTHKPKKSKKK